MKLAYSLLSDLVSFPSVTPEDAGALDYVEKFLKDRFFTVVRKQLDGAGCLYAKRGVGGKNFCFSGHVDVVPTGDLSLWRTDPFCMVCKNDFLYGRGVCDMKGGIAAFLSAVDAVIKESPQLFEKDTISIMLTSDEEKAGITSCKAFLEHLASVGENIDYCLIGEPTSYGSFGDSIKVGRRGSVTIDLKVFGLGGHVAYPKLTNNPMKPLVRFLDLLQRYRWDEGDDYFEPSNLEVVGVNSSESVSNLIPNYATAKLNIRFNVLQTAEGIEAVIRRFCGDVFKEPFSYEVRFTSGNRPFVSKSKVLFKAVKEAIKGVTGVEAYPSTGGGASDGSYISKYCDDLVEFGVINLAAHKANEFIHVNELRDLVSVYKETILLTLV